MDEPIKKKHRTGGLLTKAEKAEFLDLVRGGHGPFQAAKILHRGYSTIANSIDADKEFAAAVIEAKSHGLSQKVENCLLDLAKGKYRVKTVTYKAVWKNGEQVLNEDGTPLMRLAEEKIQQLPPDKEAQKTYLKAHRANYRDQAPAAGQMGTDDSDAIKRELAEKFGVEILDS